MPLDPNTRHGRGITEPLNVRLHPRGKRAAFHALARDQGTTASDVVNDLVSWWMGEAGARLPERPHVQRRQ